MKNKRKKRVLALLMAGTIIGSMALTGCGDNGGDKGEESKGTEESTVSEGGDVRIGAFGSTYDNIVETAELFNAQERHSGKIICEKIDDNYTTVIPTLVSGEGVLDMIEIQSREPAQFYLNYGTDSFVDLTDIVEPVDEWVAHTVANMKAEDGKYYAFPWNVGPCALYYRPEIFEEAGVDIASIKTWDDYIEAGKQIKEKTGCYMMASTANGTHCDDIMMLLNQQGGQYYDEDGKVDLGNPEMLKAVEIMKKMFDNDLIYDCPNIWDDRIKAINDEKVATVPIAVWYAGTMLSSCADQSGKWKVAELPAIEEGGNINVNLGGSAILVSSTSKNIELCKEFLTFAMKTSEGNEINFKWGSFPAYKPSYSDSYYQNEDEYFGGQKIGEFFSDHVDAPSVEYGPAFRDLQDELKLATGELFKDGTDPKAVLDAASDKVQSLIDSKQ